MAYDNRTPHIHFKVTLKGRPAFTTQMFFKGEPLNANDILIRRIRDEKQRESVIVDLKPLEESTLNERRGTFDIVLGFTPEDA